MEEHRNSMDSNDMDSRRTRGSSSSIRPLLAVAAGRATALLVLDKRLEMERAEGETTQVEGRSGREDDRCAS